MENLLLRYCPVLYAILKSIYKHIICLFAPSGKQISGNNQPNTNTEHTDTEHTDTEHTEHTDTKHTDTKHTSAKHTTHHRSRSRWLEAFLLVVDLVALAGWLCFIIYIVFPVLGILLVFCMAAIGIVLNFVSNLAVPNLPEMLPNIYQFFNWAMEFGEGLFTTLIQQVGYIFQDGPPSLVVLCKRVFEVADIHPIACTVSHFWQELVSWIATL